MIQVPPDVCFSQNAAFPAILGISQAYSKGVILTPVLLVAIDGMSYLRLIEN